MILESSNNQELSVEYEKIQDYMAGRRMCSIENLARTLELPVAEIYPALELLDKNGVIRIAKKNCGSSCSDCSSDCETAAIDPTAIIISLKSGEQ